MWHAKCNVQQNFVIKVFYFPKERRFLCNTIRHGIEWSWRFFKTFPDVVNFDIVCKWSLAIFLRIFPSDIEAVFYVFQHKTQYFQRTSAHVWFGCKRWRIAFSCQRRQAREALDRTSTLKGILPVRQCLLRIKPLQNSGPCISLVPTWHIRRGFLYF